MIYGRQSAQALGCVPEIVVCDNLRAGVKKAHRYEPDVNATYQNARGLR
jgi:hypothetical protein